MMMNILNQQMELVSIFDIQPHPDNPRHGDLGAIIQSIEKHGFYGALIVQRSTGYILAGNHRYLAAVELGYSELPVIYVDVDQWQAKQILLVDNKTSDEACYDDVRLAELLQELVSDVGSLEGTGFDESELDELLSMLEKPGGGSSTVEDDTDEGLEVECPFCHETFVVGV